ncbi:MAG TPA: homoserine kinase [Chthoniobacterales bacterium]|jgi:homoserine kinase|nr:homoserine kinase [Chthoniobacterales bacterium]
MVLSIQVPASTTNLGPGFDCLGVALELWNRIRVVPGEKEAQNPSIVSEAANLFFDQTGIKRFAFRCVIEGDIPQARGLGSSVTIRAGVLLALNALAAGHLTKKELCELCTKLEGHPDNAAAALYGGFTIVSKARNEIARFDIDPDLKFVLFIPNFEVKTSEARRVLPESFSRQAVVENLANTSFVAAAFASRRYGQLQDSFEDRVHQPFRTQFVPFLPKVLSAARNAGALGGFLSGSGSTIACLTLSDSSKVAASVADAAPEAKAKVLIVSADNLGARILEG